MKHGDTEFTEQSTKLRDQRFSVYQFFRDCWSFPRLSGGSKFSTFVCRDSLSRIKFVGQHQRLCMRAETKGVRRGFDQNELSTHFCINVCYNDFVWCALLLQRTKYQCHDSVYFDQWRILRKHRNQFWIFDSWRSRKRIANRRLWAGWFAAQYHVLKWIRKYGSGLWRVQPKFRSKYRIWATEFWRWIFAWHPRGQREPSLQCYVRSFFDCAKRIWRLFDQWPIQTFRRGKYSCRRRPVSKWDATGIRGALSTR